MNTQFWVIQAFNGISYGALLFLVGSGLSLIFGVMRIVNLSHGAYFLWGGYIALSVIAATGSWALSLPVAALAVAAIGLVDGAPVPALGRLRPTAQRRDRVRHRDLGRRWRWRGWLPAVAASWPQFVAVVALASIILFFVLSRISILPIDNDVLRQVLLTVGFAFLFQQGALDIWGGNNMDINPPKEFDQSMVIGGMYFPAYRMFMIATALAIGIVLWLAMEKTRMGAAVRATVDDAQMARGVGIDTNRISMFIFALGAFLAALGGVTGGAFLGIYPGLDFEMLPLAFAVVIIGGMG